MRRRLRTIGRAILVIYGATFTTLLIPVLLSVLTPGVPEEQPVLLNTILLLLAGTLWVFAITCWVVVPVGVFVGVLAWPWVLVGETRRAVVLRGAGVGFVLAVLPGAGWPMFELLEWIRRTDFYEILGELRYVGKHLLAAVFYSLLASCSFVPWFAGWAWLESRETAGPGVTKPEPAGPEL